MGWLEFFHRSSGCPFFYQILEQISSAILNMWDILYIIVIIQPNSAMCMSIKQFSSAIWSIWTVSWTRSYLAAVVYAPW